MKRTKENYPFFNLFSIVGTWESINLNPTVIIYRNDRDYLFSIIYVSYIVFKVTKLRGHRTMCVNYGNCKNMLDCR